MRTKRDRAGLPLTPPNLISVMRLLSTPVLFVLVLRPEPSSDVAALLLFAAAAVSDYVDGWLARIGGWSSALGGYLDPAADKLLLAATFVPFYLITGAPDAVRRIPVWGDFPLWVLAVILGREVLVSVAALDALRRGATVRAQWAGKWKAAVEDLFAGALLLLWVLERSVWPGGTPEGPWESWAQALRLFVAGSLAASLVLAVVSLLADARHLRQQLARTGR